MYIIAGENQLTITKQNVHRDNGVGLILNIEVARDSIAIGELETIVNDITANAYEITVYDDNDEKIAILSGFHCEPSIIAKGDAYKVELIDASENAFQIGRHKFMIENLERDSSNHGTAISKHDDDIKAHDAVLKNHEDNLDKQNNTIVDLEEQLAMQDEVAIELYEAQASQNDYVATLEGLLVDQERINTEQDDALIELYELLGGH